MNTSKKAPPGTERQDDIDVRIEKLKQEAAALSDGQMRAHVSADCPPDIEEQFWKRVIAFENAPHVEPLQVLVQSGLTLPPPEQVDDAQLTVKLWEAIHGDGVDRDVPGCDGPSERPQFVHTLVDRHSAGADGTR